MAVAWLKHNLAALRWYSTGSFHAKRLAYHSAICELSDSSLEGWWTSCMPPAFCSMHKVKQLGMAEMTFDLDSSRSYNRPVKLDCDWSTENDFKYLLPTACRCCSGPSSSDCRLFPPLPCTRPYLVIKTSMGKRAICVGAIVAVEMRSVLTWLQS